VPGQHCPLLPVLHSSAAAGLVDLKAVSSRDLVAALLELAGGSAADGNRATGKAAGTAGAPAPGSVGIISTAVLGGLTQIFGSQRPAAGGLRGPAAVRDKSKSRPAQSFAAGGHCPQGSSTPGASSSAAAQAAAVPDPCEAIGSLMPVSKPRGGPLTVELALQIQLLADGCLLALQQVQKVTALSSLMGDCPW